MGAVKNAYIEWQEESAFKNDELERPDVITRFPGHWFVPGVDGGQPTIYRDLWIAVDSGHVFSTPEWVLSGLSPRGETSEVCSLSALPTFQGPERTLPLDVEVEIEGEPEGKFTLVNLGPSLLAGLTGLDFPLSREGEANLAEGILTLCSEGSITDPRDISFRTEALVAEHSQRPIGARIAFTDPSAGSEYHFDPLDGGLWPLSARRRHLDEVIFQGIPNYPVDKACSAVEIKPGMADALFYALSSALTVQESDFVECFAADSSSFLGLNDLSASIFLAALAVHHSKEFVSSVSSEEPSQQFARWVLGHSESVLVAEPSSLCLELFRSVAHLEVDVLNDSLYRGVERDQVPPRGSFYPDLEETVDALIWSLNWATQRDRVITELFKKVSPSKPFKVLVRSERQKFPLVFRMSPVIDPSLVVSPQIETVDPKFVDIAHETQFQLRWTQHLPELNSSILRLPAQWHRDLEVLGALIVDAVKKTGFGPDYDISYEVEQKSGLVSEASERLS